MCFTSCLELFKARATQLISASYHCLEICQRGHTAPKAAFTRSSKLALSDTPAAGALV